MSTSSPPVVSPQEETPAGSGLRARVLTAAVLVPAVVATVWWGPTWLVALLVGVVISLALSEFFDLCEAGGSGGLRRWTMACAWLILAGETIAADVSIRGQLELLGSVREAEIWLLWFKAALLLFALGATALVLTRRRALVQVLPALGGSAGGLLLVALPLTYLVTLHGQPPVGPKLLLFTLVLIWAGDTLAYFLGRAVGRTPMAPVISPKKTWEGAAANLAGSLLVAWPFARWIEEPTALLLVTAGLANVAGQLGDLAESAYKRSAGVKDSGTLLPGHGGVLDRIDSLIFAAPVVWWCYAVFLVMMVP